MFGQKLLELDIKSMVLNKLISVSVLQHNV